MVNAFADEQGAARALPKPFSFFFVDMVVVNPLRGMHLYIIILPQDSARAARFIMGLRILSVFDTTRLPTTIPFYLAEQCPFPEAVRRDVSKTLKDINPTPSEASAVVAGRDGFANVHRLTPTYTSRLPRARLTSRLWG